MQMWQDELITKCLPLGSHMSEDMFTQYPKECLPKAKQIPTLVSDLIKKFVTKNKTKQLGS